jgi:hypothetical protein
MRFEPDAVAVSEADDRNGNVEEIRGERGNAIAGGVGCGIEDLIAPERREAQAFFVGGHRGGYRNVETAALCRLDRVEHDSRPQAGYRGKGPFARGTSETLGRGADLGCSHLHIQEVIREEAPRAPDRTFLEPLERLGVGTMPRGGCRAGIGVGSSRTR